MATCSSLHCTRMLLLERESMLRRHVCSIRMLHGHRPLHAVAVGACRFMDAFVQRPSGSSTESSSVDEGGSGEEWSGSSEEDNEELSSSSIDESGSESRQNTRVHLAQLQEARLHLLVGHLVTLLAKAGGSGLAGALSSASGLSGQPSQETSTSTSTAPSSATLMPATPFASAVGLGNGGGAATGAVLTEMVAFLRAQRLMPSWVASLLTKDPATFDAGFRRAFTKVCKMGGMGGA
jgi:hypothetical protein